MTLDPAVLAAEAKRTKRDVRPFLRWAGSKRRLLPQIVPFLPREYENYFEPFLGGGSLATLLQPSKGALADRSPELMETWQTVIANPSAVAAAIELLPLEKETYYRVRGMRPTDSVSKAARFIYLNRGAFNGLYRVNQQGAFNVPWGAPKSSLVVAAGLLQNVSDWVQRGSLAIRCADFEESFDEAREGDLIFADPPYHAIKPDGRDFRHYNDELFSFQDQERLAASARAARARGVHVLVTNSASAEIAALYSGFRTVELKRTSTIAAAADRRLNVTEYLFVSP